MLVGLTVPEVPVCDECTARLAAAEHGSPAPLEERLAAAGVPWRFRRGWGRADWERTFGPWPAAELAAWQPRSAKSMLTVVGGAGEGKTGLATLLLAAAVEAGRRALWVAVQDLLDRLRAAHAAEAAESPHAARYRLEALELERSCADVDVLVLDDLFGARHSTPFGIERVLAIVAGRYDDGLQTAVTTNRTLGQLAAINPSLASRLRSGVFLMLERAGGDVRGYET